MDTRYSASTKEVTMMGLRVCFSVILLLSLVSCNGKVEELEERQEAAEKEVQEATQMQQKAPQVVEQKKRIKQARSPVARDAQVELLGSVAVWGQQPETMSSAQGMVVQIYNKDGTRTYSAFVDADNRFKVAVAPGQYSLIINQPGYELYQQEITVDGRLNLQLLRPIGLKNLK
jgi:hypothetical protein